MAGTTYKPLAIPPGVWKDRTPWLNKGRWIDSDKIKFVHGRPEKQGGTVAFSNQTYVGTPRDLWTWTDLSGVKYLAIGTECILYVNRGGQFYDITPIRETVSGSGFFSTSAGSLDVLVSVSAHGLSNNDLIYVSGATTIGGNVLVSGRYATSVVNVNSFIINAGVTAADTSASTGPSTTNILFYIPCGPTSNILGFGWGTGTWGSGTWGTPRSSSNVTLDMRQWTFDNYGEDLLAVPQGLNMYRWQPSTSVTSRAVIVTAAPSVVDFVLVSEQDRHVFALGTTEQASGNYDPLLLRWCSQENINDWIASATNTAGEKRLGSGNYIAGGVRSKNQNLVWTDNALYGIPFIGPPFTFGAIPLGTNCGLIAPHAAIDVNGTAYWMSRAKKFFMYNGTVRELPCTIKEFVFDNLNDDQATKVFVGFNSKTSEVIWLWPDKDNIEINRYAKYNVEEKCWDVGTWSRTVWRDQSVFDYPIAGYTSGPLYYHEVTTTPDDNGAALPSFIKSGVIDVAEGDELLYIDSFIPDFELNGNINVTFTTQKYPRSTTVTKGPYLVSAGTTRKGVQARGRLVTIEFSTSGIGDYWRLGNFTFAGKADGKQ